MSELAASILRKAEESAATTRTFFTAEAGRVEGAARAMAAAFDEGGRLFVMGNGGSAADAMHLAVELMHPIIGKRPALPAIALSADPALLTASANDGDFSVAWADALRVLGKKGDIALGISTSGRSANVNRALLAAREMGMLTVGFAGKDGGKMACEHLFVVQSFSIHRIQEVHTALLHILWDAIHVARGEEDVVG